MHVCVCVSVSVWGGVRRSVPAAGLRLQPWGLICASAGNWGHWDPGAATGCQSPAAGEVHIVHVYISTSRPLSCSDREGSRMRK